MKNKITYSTRLRKEDTIEIRVKHRKRDSKVFTNIVAAKQEEESNIRYEEKFNKLYVLLFNFYVLTRQTKRGNRLLNKLLVKTTKNYA